MKLPMPTPSENKAVILSQKLYQRLLAAYPKTHRQEYGPAMAQLFRDQSRDAWRESRGWGLTKLWLRVLPDLVKTSVLEHLSTLKGRKSMIERIGTLFRPRSTPFLVFLKVFVAVFALVVITSTVITFILPDTYASATRIKPDGTVNDLADQAEFEAIQSEVVLGKVIEALNLNAEWGKKFGRGNNLRTSETLALLRMRLDLRPVRNTSFIEIRTYSENPKEAATIANAVAEA